MMTTKTSEAIELIVKNLRPIVGFTNNGVRYENDSFLLSYNELEYLGF